MENQISQEQKKESLFEMIQNLKPTIESLGVLDSVFNHKLQKSFYAIGLTDFEITLQGSLTDELQKLLDKVAGDFQLVYDNYWLRGRIGCVRFAISLDAKVCE